MGAVTALAGLLFGFDVSVISGAMEFIQNEFHASDLMLEWIVSALLIGAVVGALLAGFLSNTFGRKRTLLLSGFIFIVGALCCALSPSAQALMAARFLLGIAVGMADFIAPLYLSESSPKKVRGSMISLYQLMVTIGIMLSYLSDLFFGTLLSLDGNAGGHWRLMLGVIMLPAALLFCGGLFLPESPHWLFLKGFQQRGTTVFRQIFCSEEEVANEVEKLSPNISY
jgi:SP family galactose:H+ symporter-like MFS transporter